MVAGLPNVPSGLLSSGFAARGDAYQDMDGRNNVGGIFRNLVRFEPDFEPFLSCHWPRRVDQKFMSCNKV